MADALDQLLQLRQRGHWHETNAADPASVHTVQYQHVEVDVQVERAAETLDKRHGARLCLYACERGFAGLRSDRAVVKRRSP